jgi:ABC-2 type transport system ATP-binding protein
VHAGRMVLLGLRRPPAQAELAALPGVAAVESMNGKLYRLQFSADADPTEQIVACAVERNWGLFQITPAQTSLEDVFVDLTR